MDRMSRAWRTGVHPVERGDGQTQQNGGWSIQEQQNQCLSKSLLRAPFPVVYEDENVFIYEKPAGWVCASPNPKVKSSYTAVKAYLEAVRGAHRRALCQQVSTRSQRTVGRGQVHGVAGAPAKTLELFAKGMYVMVQGHLAADDELYIRPENSDPYALPYRTMRATNLHTLLKFKAGYEVIKDMGLRCVATIAVDWGGQIGTRSTQTGRDPFVCPGFERSQQ